MQIFSLFDTLLEEKSPLVSKVLRLPSTSKDYSIINYESLPPKGRKLAFYLQEAFNSSEKNRSWYRDQLRRMKQLTEILDKNPSSSPYKCHLCGRPYPEEYMIAVKDWCNSGTSSNPLKTNYYCPECLHYCYCTNHSERQTGLRYMLYRCDVCGSPVLHNYVSRISNIPKVGQEIRLLHNPNGSNDPIIFTEEDIDSMQKYKGSCVCRDCLYEDVLGSVLKTHIMPYVDKREVFDFANSIIRELNDEYFFSFTPREAYFAFKKSSDRYFISNQEVLKRFLGLIKGIPSGKKGADDDPFMKRHHMYMFKGSMIDEEFRSIRSLMEAKKVHEYALGTEVYGLFVSISSYLGIEFSENIRKDDDDGFIKIMFKEGEPDTGVFGLFYAENCNKGIDKQEILKILARRKGLNVYLDCESDAGTVEKVADNPRDLIWPVLKTKSFPSKEELISKGIVSYSVKAYVNAFDIDIDEEDHSVTIEFDFSYRPKLVKADIEDLQYVCEKFDLYKYIKEFDKIIPRENLSNEESGDGEI